ncbi:paired amphipathic helix protein Sin3b [Trichonephila clavipes]|nr:paired amphipathic helix protein Sin3b [Trichonephila clavipes]
MKISSCLYCGIFFPVNNRVKAAFGYDEVYNNFLRCLMLYADDIVTRSELVQMITPFLGTFPELYKQFKDMLGFNENGVNVEYIPMKMIKLENARNKSGIAADIDFSAGGRNGASYLPLAPDFKHPKCSSRTPLCDEVLNDTWVSFPTWSEDSTFVQSCKTQYEEIIYRCEDERFELDMAISSNNYALQILEKVQKKISKMTAEEKSTFALDNYLGGTSLVLQRKALHRLYGDKTEELVEGLKRNPVVAVPIILKRLKVKEDEWKEKEKGFNEIWRSQIDQYYLKSLDHQGINFKQNDSKTFRPKGILNDLEMVIAESKANPQQMEPHFTLEFKEVEVFLDAINLMLQYLKKLPGVHRDDRRKIELVIRSFIPYIFDAPSATKIGNNLEIDEETQGDSMDVDNEGKERSGQNSSAGSSKDGNDGSSEEDSNEEAQSDESDKALIEEIDVFEKMDPLPTTNMPYTLFFVSKIWFVFFRQFHILIERLARFLHESNSKEALVKQDGNEDKSSGEENPKSLYKELIESLTHLLNGVVDYSQFEEEARSLFGIHAYFSFTMDKLILSIVRQLQQVVADDICKQCTAFFNQHTKKLSTGGCTSGVEASQIEHQYLRKVEKMMDAEQVFKVIFYKNLRILTIELLEIEETSPDPIKAEKWSNYLDTYFDEDFCNEELLAEVQQAPVFLKRNLRKQMLFWKNRVMQVEKQWHQRQSSKSMKKHLPLSARKKRALSIIAPILRKKPRRLSIPESSVQPSCSGVVSNDGNEPHSFDNIETIKPVGKFFKDNKEELDAKEQRNKIIGDDQVMIESEENLEKPDIPEKEENFLGYESVVIDAVSSPNAQTGEVTVESPKSLPQIADQNSKETAVDEATKEELPKEEVEKMEVDKDADTSFASPEKTNDSVLELEDSSEEKSEDVMVPESSLKAIDSDTDMKSKGDLAENSVNHVMETNKDPKEEEPEAIEDSNSVEKTDETEPGTEKSIGKKKLKQRVIQKTSEYAIKTRKNRIKRKMKHGLLRSSNSSKRKQRQTKCKFEVLDDPTFDFAYFSELPESDKVSHLAFKYVTVENNEEVTFMKGSSKIRFVQNHGLFVHRKDSLTRAKETHQAVSEIKASNFNAWHRIWLERYVTPSMIKACNDWLLRSDKEKFKLFQVTVSDCTKPPYIPYNKYKVCHFKTVT